MKMENHMFSSEIAPGIVYFWGQCGLRIWLADELKKAQPANDRPSPVMSLTGDKFCDLLMLNCLRPILDSKGEMMTFPYVASGGTIPFLYTAKLLHDAWIDGESGPALVLRLFDDADDESQYEELVFHVGYSPNQNGPDEAVH
jgi:hypothetical protein